MSLIELRADKEAIDIFGWRALHIAAFGGYVSVVRRYGGGFNKYNPETHGAGFVSLEVC
jgi:hypothetical protein